MDFTRNFGGKLFGKRGEELGNTPYTGMDMYFKLAKSVRNWQLAFIINSIFLLIILGHNIYLTTSITKVPYVIEVEKSSGVISNIGDIRKIKYIPNDKNIFAALGRHIIATRSIPLDQVRYGKDIQEQYYFLNKVTQQKLLEYITKDNVEEKMRRKESRDVSITSVLKMQENTYQVRWTENNYSDTGNIYSTVPMVGMFTVDYITPESEDMLMVNSLGIIITDFSYSQEM